MRKIFHWFYCLPIGYAAALVFLATVAFLTLRKKCRHIPCWRGMVCIMLLCWIAVIGCGTLGLRAEGIHNDQPILLPFYSYYTALNGGQQELYRTNFMNTILFYPAGLLGCELLANRKGHSRHAIPVTCFFALMSVAIEYAQYHFRMGLAETDDVIHNTLGALLGALAVSLPPRLMGSVRKPK